jgi:hypothetical protein
MSKAVLHVSYRLALAALRVPSLVSILIFVAIYIATEVAFSVAFVPIFSGWQPAFPLSWRSMLLLLFVVPTFAFTQVLRLLLPLLIGRWNRAPGRVSLSTQVYVMLQRGGAVTRHVELFGTAEEEHVLLEHAEEGNERSSWRTSPAPSAAGPHHKQLAHTRCVVDTGLQFSWEG